MLMGFFDKINKQNTSFNWAKCIYILNIEVRKYGLEKGRGVGLCLNFCFFLFQAVVYALSPLMRLANWMSFGMMVTLLAWMAHRLVSSNRPTK